MNKQQILDTLNKWREYAESIPATENQIVFIKAQADPCLICIESLNMLSAINGEIRKTLDAVWSSMQSGSISLDDPQDLASVAFPVGLYNDWHTIAVECILRTANAGHKQLLAKNIQPLGGCIAPAQLPPITKPTIH
jgi:hypothetical protein